LKNKDLLKRLVEWSSRPAAKSSYLKGLSLLLSESLNEDSFLLLLDLAEIGRNKEIGLVKGPDSNLVPESSLFLLKRLIDRKDKSVPADCRTVYLLNHLSEDWNMEKAIMEMVHDSKLLTFADKIDILTISIKVSIGTMFKLIGDHQDEFVNDIQSISRKPMFSKLPDPDQVYGFLIKHQLQLQSHEFELVYYYWMSRLDSSVDIVKTFSRYFQTECRRMFVNFVLSKDPKAQDTNILSILSAQNLNHRDIPKEEFCSFLGSIDTAKLTSALATFYLTRCEEADQNRVVDFISGELSFEMFDLSLLLSKPENAVTAIINSPRFIKEFKKAFNHTTNHSLFLHHFWSKKFFKNSGSAIRSMVRNCTERKDETIFGLIVDLLSKDSSWIENLRVEHCIKVHVVWNNPFPDTVNVDALWNVIGDTRYPLWKVGGSSSIF